MRTENTVEDNRKTGYEHRASEIVLFILLDAFRADYLYRTRFLRSLAESGIWGRLHEPFGFCPRATYFGGLDPEDIGYTHMFIRAQGRHPFRFAGQLSTALTRDTACMPMTRKLVETIARERATSFENLYLTTGEIPLEELAGYELAEKYPPWDRRVGYQSLFHMLDAQASPWMQCSWPYTNIIENTNDKKILDTSISMIEPFHRFGYIHFSDLDHCGHEHGPESSETVNVIEKTDAIVEHLYNYCKNTFEQVHVLIIGDHGMVPVHTGIDIDDYLAQTGLVKGEDYESFIDSTMVRFWYSSDAVGEKLAKHLSEKAGVVVVSKEMKRKWRIANCTENNGQLIAMARPGVIFAPNYFQSDTKLIKGMHGYEPEHSDNSGILLVNSSKQNLCGRLQNNDARVVFSTLCDLLGLDHAQAKVDSALQQSVQQNSVYVSCDNEEPLFRDVVDHAMEDLKNEMKEYQDSIDSVILHGSYGRGEGQFFRYEDKIELVNDLDILVVLQTPDKTIDVSGLSKRMKAISGLPFYDIACIGFNDLSKMKPSMFTYDLQTASRVIWGDKNVLNMIPPFGAADIPVWDGVELLLNRCAGMLMALNKFKLSAKTYTDEDLQFLDNQLLKAWRSFGDWQLLKWNAYHASYIRRAERIRVCRDLVEFPESIIDRILYSYERKYVPENSKMEELGEACQIWCNNIETVVSDAITQMTGRKCSILADCIKALEHWKLYLSMSGKKPFRENLRKRLLAYRTIITVLERTVAESVFEPEQNDSDWRKLSIDAVELWEKYCH